MTKVTHNRNGTLRVTSPDWSHIPRDCWIEGCVGGETKRKLDCFDDLVSALGRLHDRQSCGDHCPNSCKQCQASAALEKARATATALATPQAPKE